MITHSDCSKCIHKTVCKVIEEYQEEIDRINKKNESEDRSFVTIVNCNNYDTVGDVLLKYKYISDLIPEDPADFDEYYNKILSNIPYPLEIYTSSFRYECFFKSDIEKMMNKEIAVNE